VITVGDPTGAGAGAGSAVITVGDATGGAGAVAAL